MLPLLALRLAFRELFSGTWPIVLLALCIAAMATSSVFAASVRLETAVLGQAAEFLAADQVYDSPQKPPADWPSRAQALGLHHATTVEFVSMARAKTGNSMLVSAKAVSANYPLRGRLQGVLDEKVWEQLQLQQQPVPSADVAVSLAPGEVWLDSRLFAALGLQLGDTLELADGDFTAARIVANEPDRASSLGALVPRALLAMEDLAATGAVRPGSRVRWRFLLKGEPEALAQFHASLTEQEGEMYSLISPKTREGASGDAIRDTLSYIRLAGILVLLLSLLAGALAGHRYFSEQQPRVALLKTLGISGRRLLMLYFFVLLWGSLLALSTGLALGWGVQWWLGALLAREFGTWTDAPDISVFVLAASVSLLGFVSTLAPALLATMRVTPMRLLRAEHASRGGIMSALLPIAAVAIVLVLGSGQEQGIALLLALAVLGLVAVLLAYVLSRLPGRGRVHNLPWYLCRANWRRRRAANSLQLFVLGTVVFPCALLYGWQASLFDSWERLLSREVPNYFLNNISQSEHGHLRQELQELGATVSEFSPLVRGRWLRIVKTDGEVVVGNLQRSVNFSWADSLPAGNEIVAGRWWHQRSRLSGSDAYQHEISLEEDYARELGVAPGDQLVAISSGQELRFRITSLRRVNWFGMTPNFFVLVPAGALPVEVATRVGSFFLPAEQASALNALMRTYYPAVNLFEMDALLHEARAIVDRLATAIYLLLAMLIVTSALVLIETSFFDLAERRRQGTLMRVFGASGRALRLALMLELAVTGLMGGLASVGVADLLLRMLMPAPLEAGLSWLSALVLIGLSVLSLLLLGLLLLRPVLRVPPGQILRSGLTPR